MKITHTKEMKIKPLNHVVLVEKIEKKVSTGGGLYMPEKQEGRFIKVKVFAIGNLVEGIKVGDIAYANPLIEPIDFSNKNVGFLKSTDIMAIIENESN